MDKNIYNSNESIFALKNSFKDISNIKTIQIKRYECIKEVKYTISIPTYKRSSDLDIALQSVINQDTEENYYICVVDNNPERDDETECLIKSKYSDQPNLAYYKNGENVGMAGNWNRLFQLCETPYLIMLHDDDMLFTSFMSRIAKLLKRYKNVSALNAGKINWDGEKSSYKEKEKLNDGVIRHTKYTNFAHFIFGQPSGCLFKVEHVTKLGGFDPNTYPSIDYVLIQKMILSNLLVLQAKEKLMFYRIVGNTSSKINTFVKWIEIDYQIRKELGVILRLPRWYVELVNYFETKIHLCTISKMDAQFVCDFKKYKKGGLFFHVFFRLYRFFYDYYYELSGRIKK